MDSATEQSPAVVVLMAVALPVMIVFGLRANAIAHRKNRPSFGSFLRVNR